MGWALPITRRAPFESAISGSAGGRVDAERGAEREEHVAARRGPLRPVQVLGHEVLAEADRGGLQHPAAHEARRVLLAGLDPLPASRPSGPRHPHCRHFASCTVPWISISRDARRPGGEVQPVDVLGDERVHRRLLLQLRDRAVAGVRLRLPDLAAQPVLPRELPDLGVRDVVLERRGLLRRGVLRPDPCGPRKSGMPDSVEIPAPVRITIARASRSHVAMVSSASSSAIGSSVPAASGRSKW